MRGTATFFSEKKVAQRKPPLKRRGGLTFSMLEARSFAPAEGTSCAILGARDLLSRVFRVAVFFPPFLLLYHFYNTFMLPLSCYNATANKQFLNYSEKKFNVFTLRTVLAW